MEKLDLLKQKQTIMSKLLTCISISTVCNFVT